MGSFEVQVPFNQIRDRIEQAKSQVQVKQSEVVEALGIQALSLAQKDYRTLSRGGTASDGRRWKALSPKTIAMKSRRGRKSGKKLTFLGNVLPSGRISAIGIDTGLQMASASPGFHGSDGRGGNIFEAGPKSVTIGYGRIYSKYFDIARKLLPEVLPESWRQALDRVVQAWLQKITAGIRSK